MNEFVYETKEDVVFFFPRAKDNPKAPLDTKPVLIDGKLKEQSIWINRREDGSIKSIMVTTKEPYQRNNEVPTQSYKPTQTIADVTIDNNDVPF